jgi:hypothetical protein
VVVHLATKRLQKKRSALTIPAANGSVEIRLGLGRDSTGTRGQPFQSNVKGFPHCQSAV